MTADRQSRFSRESTTESTGCRMSRRTLLCRWRSFCWSSGIPGAGDAATSRVPGAIAIAILLMIADTPVAAQNLAVSWWTVDGGGGTSLAGPYSVSGTAGQPDAGAAVGGSFALSSGFWSVTTTAIQPTRLPTPTPLPTSGPTRTATPPPPLSVPAGGSHPLIALIGIGMLLLGGHRR
jgi:hypothetical protein